MKRRVQSITYAIDGMVTMLKEEPNARIHLVVMFVVLGISWYLKISSQEWLAIIIAIGMVLGAEALNTAIEQVSNAITLEQNEYIRKTKDLAAAAVLISAITAVVIGMVVFLPKLHNLLQ